MLQSGREVHYDVCVLTAAGAHPVDGGVFPPPPAAAELLTKIPPPSSFQVGHLFPFCGKYEIYMFLVGMV